VLWIWWKTRVIHIFRSFDYVNNSVDNFLSFPHYTPSSVNKRLLTCFEQGIHS